MCGAHAPPPTVPNSFVFAYIFAKKYPHWRSTPPLTGPRPLPHGKSWICHCYRVTIITSDTEAPAEKEESTRASYMQNIKAICAIFGTVVVFVTSSMSLQLLQRSNPDFEFNALRYATAYIPPCAWIQRNEKVASDT